MGKVAWLLGVVVLASAGPAAAQYRSQSVADAPAHLKFMSARCSSLNEALRTSSARGLHYDTVAQLRRDYQAGCAEEEREAFARLAAEQRDKSNQKLEAKLGEARQRERTALQQEQCVESRRILKTKRARTDLTEGEKAELERFESNFKARCG